jgi:hypothetical protein
MTMPAPAETGRGAWTSRGNKVASRYYKRGCSTTAAAANQDEWAVKQGTAAIQTLLSVPLVDGSFGAQTEAAVKSFQSVNGLVADGVVGAKTAQKLIKRVITPLEAKYGVPENLAYGIVFHESGFDPGAVGYSTPLDLGLSQINTKWGTDPYSAMNPLFNLDFVAKKAGVARAKYLTQTSNQALVYDATILQHHAPSWANYLVANGTYPNAEARLKSETYIAKVKQKIALL